jgi:hypothetical protein
MTLYLHPSITPEVVREAKEAGILGIKVRCKLLLIYELLTWYAVVPKWSHDEQ